MDGLVLALALRVAGVALLAGCQREICELDGQECDLTSATVDRGGGAVVVWLHGPDEACVLVEGNAPPGVDVYALAFGGLVGAEGPQGPNGEATGWVWAACPPDEGQLPDLQLTGGTVALREREVELDVTVGRLGDGRLAGHIRLSVPIAP